MADRRRLTFLALLAALVAALLLSGPRRPEPPPAPARTTGQARPAPPSPDAAPAALSRTARRFLTAFLAHEVGAGGARSAARLRRRATGALARRLLDRPLPHHSPKRRAAIEALRIHPVRAHPDLALVSGTARRPSGPEPFAFLFARRGGRWLAVAPAE